MTDSHEQLSKLSPEQRALLLLRLKKQKEQAAKKENKAIIRQSRDSSEFPLSFAQQRIWFLQQFEKGSVEYNFAMTFSLTGRLHVSAFENSINDIVRRHETLRTSFKMVDGQPIQVISPALSIPLNRIDLTPLPKDEQTKKIRQLAQQEAESPFDLACGPLLRVSLLRLDDEDHVLFLTTHHIVFDGWSKAIFNNELSALYQANINGTSADLPDLAIQYADFSFWQNQLLDGDQLSGQLDYWKNRLAGAPPVVSFPTDKARGRSLKTVVSAESFSIEPDLGDKLKQLCRQSSTTLFTAVFAAFSLLLSRYSGSQDVVIGTPMADRSHREIENLIGLFLNTIALRIDLAAQPSFHQLLEQVRQASQEALDNQDIPFQKLVEELHPERNLQHTPVFQVMFILQSAPKEGIDLTGLEVTPLKLRKILPGTNYDITFSIEDKPNEIAGVVEYNSDLYTPGTICRIIENFKILLQSVVNSPEQPVSTLPLLAASEKERLLLEWNRTDAVYTPGLCLHELFERQAEITPESICAVFRNEKLSYRELNERSNRVAHRLLETGLDASAILGIYMDRSLDMLASIIGILKAGYSYLPLDPTYPADRLAFMLEDSQAAAVLSQRPLADSLPAQIENVICVDEEDREARDEAGKNPGRAVNSGDIAYVIYTSGSTGKPKGVQVPHKAVVNFLHAMSHEPGITEHDTLYSVTTLSFDISVLELLLPITTGARVVIADSEVVYDGKKLLAEIKASKASMMQATPATWRLLLDAGWQEKLPLKILSGGEALSPQLASRLIEQGESLWNLYGPTEATIWSTVFRIDTNVASDEPSVPIGRPIGNARIFILDESLQLVPIGAAGELHIGGSGLAQGYFNRPELTAEKFIANPFSDDPEARLYKTGDLACYRADGNIQFLGRIDQQVKLRGFRIELGEIESTLADHAAVREAAVVRREDEPGDQRLVAYLVVDERNAPSIADLRALVRGKLPEYMLPSAFMLLERLPLTANGKLDRNALPLPEAERQSEETLVEPRSNQERQLVEIWSKVLKLERLGIHDNFFDLGGHSLMATQVVSRIRTQLNIELPLSEMFEHPTVAELAQVMESLPGDSASNEASLIPAVDRSGDLPLSFAQERLWFLDQLEPGSAFYNMPLVIRLQGELCVGSLTKSLNLIVDRHETLRTRYSSRNGNPVQLIDESSQFALLREDLGTLRDEARDEKLAIRIRQEAMQPFDLAHDFPVRARLLRLTECNHVLLFTMHHIISDGWSLGILFRELGVCYAAFSSGQQPELPELPVQYADFASWQREWLSGEVLAFQLDYWRHQLGDLPVLELPTDRPRPPVQTYNGAIVRNNLSKKFEAELERFSQQHGVSLFMALLAGFAGLMHRYSGQQDIVVGSPIANRNRSELEGLIGFFVNSLVIRTDVSGNPSFRELVERVNRTVLGAFDHQDLPFEKLVDEFQPDRDLSRNPMFQVMFALQNANTEKLDLQGLTLEAGGNEIQVTRFDLEVHIWQRADHFSVNFIYNTDLFDEATIKRLFSHYQMLLEAMVAMPGTRIADAPMLTEQERQQVLRDWNQTATDYPRDKTVHQLFEMQAAATPNAIALEYGDETLSYHELNLRANQLAHYLQARGVGPEVMVGISIERSREMVVGLLGILKAGGAYLPLDPDYPQSRLGFMLEDAQVKTILTTSSQQAQIPSFSGDTVCLDTDWAMIEREKTDNPVSGTSANSLIYVIYTSGSTGQPKGTLIEHRSAVRLVRETNFVELGSEEVFLQFAPIAFDASTFELWGCLLNGAKLVIFPAGRSSLEELGQVIKTRGVTTLWLTSALFSQMVDNHLDSLSGVKQLLAGGEALSLPHVKKMLAQLGERRLINGYGPTENTTFTCCHVMTSNSDPGQSVPIGRPISNTTVYILDGRMQPVPVGVPGQLYIGGDGLARGYLNQPEMSGEKFVANPFSDDPQARLYATGDQVRFRTDGAIEFIGRIDHQVKVRGYRIELGEIETALVEHAAVDEAVAIVREDEPGDKRIAAYLVPSPAWVEQISSSQSGEHVDEWQALYEETYGNIDDSLDLTRNFTGWNSSYTGEPIALPEMEEWLEASVARIGALQPKRVLEIGCGTGLLLYRLAPACERYVGTDFSAVAQQQVRGVVSTRDEYRHVELWQRLADDFSDVEAGDFDTVIINSVTQYLPSMDYLVSVIEASVEAIGDGGRIMLGDIRSLPLLKAYHTSVQLYLSPDDASTSELLRNIQQHVEEENELVIEPAFFHALQQRIPRLSHVEVLLKQGRYHNELTAYRYDVLLHIEAPAEPLSANGQWLDWGVSGLNEARLQARLSEADQAWLGIRAMPNARIARDVAVLEQLQGEGGAQSAGELKQAALTALPHPVEPGALWRLAEASGYQLELSYSGAGTDGRMDALFRRERRGDCAGAVFWPQHQEVPQRPWSAYGSNPLKGRLGNELIPLLRQHLQQQLPEYMMPSVYVVLDALPLNPNGKVERKALPVPGDVRASLGAEYTAPRTELEQHLAEIWAEVLKLERVGVHDNFFDLGGHSLMATQVVSRIRGQLNAELPLSEMFGYPTVAELAPVVELLLDESGEGAAEVIPVAGREGKLPLSFAQERLWFLDQLEPGGSAYNMPLALRLKGELSVAALRNSINAIVDRQQGLRTHFTLHQGKPFQIIGDVTIELKQDDLSAWASESLEDEVKARIDAEASQPFDLNSGPLLRCRLLRLSDHEHVLLMTMHHVISDGWSLGVLYRELGACYEAFSRGEQPALAELPIQYADFALWQREWLSGEVLASQMDYWRDQLEDLSTLNLPTDRPRPAVQTYTGSSEKIALDTEFSKRLKSLSREAGVTLFMTMLGGFAVLMQRYSGQEDIVVGTPIANRNRSELEDLIGFFVNSLVMRTDVSGSPGFTELVQRVNKTALEAYEHQDLPFEKLVDEIQPDRDLSHNPLFQVMFALQNAPVESLDLKGLTLESISREVKVSGFDLECHVWEKGDRLEVVFVYNTDLFDASTIRQMMTHYRRVLEAVVASPETPIGQLEILDDEEKRLILHQWNQTRVDFVKNETLHSLFEQQVKRTPQAIAVRFEQLSLDYSGLEQKANDIAGLLLVKNVEPGQLVGVYLERSIDLVVAVLGILKAGAAYVPLDPEYPEEHSNYIVADSNIRILLSQKKYENQLPSEVTDVIWLDSGELYENVGPQTLPVVTEDMLAYVIYTSGSTGKPKGVMVSHAAVVNHACWMQDLFKLDQTDSILQKSPISFDASVCEIFVPLLNGACVVLAVPGGDKDINYLIREIQHNKITTLILVPSALRILLQSLTDPAALSTLKRMGVGGEALTPDLQQAYYEKCSAPLYNLYGPTESTIDATSFLCEANFKHDNIPIGYPVSNKRAYILDHRMQPVPIGVHGELHIGGAGLAQGYLNQPELTAEKFIADPFCDDPAARLYKTGDMARYRADGSIEFVGRIDHQVKVRGFRIELGEIEAVLSQHEFIKACAALVYEDLQGHKNIAAYFVSDSSFSTLSLRNFLRKKLPHYMIPTLLTKLDEIPVTPNGKTDYKMLATYTKGKTIRDSIYLPPETPAEKKIAGIWETLLNVDRIGVGDNFFDIGGHSLLLIQAKSVIENEVGVSVPVVDFFHQTLGQIATYCEKNKPPEMSMEEV